MSRQEINRRTRSQTPGRVSLVKLINRLNWKLNRKKIDGNNDKENESRSRNQLDDKQMRAEINRKERESLKQEFILKENLKMNEIKEKNAEKKAKQISQVLKKLEDAEEVCLI